MTNVYNDGYVPETNLTVTFSFVTQKPIKGKMGNLYTIRLNNQTLKSIVNKALDDGVFEEYDKWFPVDDPNLKNVWDVNGIVTNKAVAMYFKCLGKLRKEPQGNVYGYNNYPLPVRDTETQEVKLQTLFAGNLSLTFEGLPPNDTHYVCPSAFW